MRPTPRPTKDTITNASRSGLEVTAPTKEPTQPTEEVTMLPTSARIAARVPAVGVVKAPPFQKIRLKGTETNYAIWIISRIIRIVRMRKPKPMK